MVGGFYGRFLLDASEKVLFLTNNDQKSVYFLLSLLAASGGLGQLCQYILLQSRDSLISQ